QKIMKAIKLCSFHFMALALLAVGSPTHAATIHWTNPPGGRSFWRRRRCSLLTDPCGYARRSRLVCAKNPLPPTCPYLRIRPLRERVQPEKHRVARGIERHGNRTDRAEGIIRPIRSEAGS